MKNTGFSILEVKKAGEVPLCDSRKITEAIGVEHKRFFSDVILEHQSQIEKITDTPIILLSQSQKGKSKGGRPTRYAMLTVHQALVALTLTKATASVLSAIGVITTEILTYNKKTKKYVWDKIGERIRPGSKLDIAFDYIHTKTHFSPEEEFCKFFHQLETSVNFSLSFDWWQYAEDMETKTEDEEEEEEIEIEENFEDTLEFEVFQYMTHDEDNILVGDVEQFISNHTHCDQHPHQYWVTRYDAEQAWIYSEMNRHVEGMITNEKNMRKAFVSFIRETGELKTKARNTVGELAGKAVYHKNELEPLKKTLKEEVIPRIAYGIKPHYDFVQWWQVNDELMARKGWATYKTVYEGELEVSGEHRGAEDFEDTYFDAPDFEDGIQIIKYEPSDEEYDDSNNDPQLQHEALFNRLAVYPIECKPVFDYYLQNIWYPEHSVAFIDSVDPEGSKYLKEALPQISPTQLRMLPRGFVKSMRECLPESGQMLISAAIDR